MLKFLSDELGWIKKDTFKIPFFGISGLDYSLNPDGSGPLSPYPSVLDFWKIEFETFFKNQVGRTWFLVYFELDFCRLHRQ